jgi:S1-C subfamily serine protease
VKALALAVFLSATVLSSHAEAQSANAVVMIWSDVAVGRGGLGTGFFVSADGRLVTSYHVVIGAVKIRVLQNGNWYENVSVRALVPSRDLAILKVNGIGGAVPFIPLSQAFPAVVTSQAPLQVVGYPAVLTNSQVTPTARLLSPTFIKSSTIRSPDSLAKLFAIDDVDLISIEMSSIYNGLSGAPLLRNNQAIGVISGSIHQGGSIAWAIPAKYLAGIAESDQPLSNIKAWPVLSLMAPSWKNLRREARIGVGLALAVDDYAAKLQHMNVLAINILNSSRLLMPTFLGIIQKVLDTEVAKRGRNAPADDNRALDAAVDDAMRTVMSKQGPLIAELEAVDESLGNATETLTRQLDAFFDTMPQTSKNIEIRRKTITAWNQQRRAVGSAADRVEGIWDDFEEYLGGLDVETLGQVQDAFPKAIKAVNDALAGSGPALNEGLAQMRGFQSIVESLFAAEPDLK